MYILKYKTDIYFKSVISTLYLSDNTVEVLEILVTTIFLPLFKLKYGLFDSIDCVALCKIIGNDAVVPKLFKLKLLLTSIEIYELVT